MIPQPKDKSKVEAAVLLAERGIFTRLHNRQRFSIEGANAAIQPLLIAVNGKTSRHLGASRRELFENLDKPGLLVSPYVYADWKQCRTGLDYQVALKILYYSVTGFVDGTPHR